MNELLNYEWMDRSSMNERWMSNRGNLWMTRVEAWDDSFLGFQGTLLDEDFTFSLASIDAKSSIQWRYISLHNGKEREKKTEKETKRKR